MFNTPIRHVPLTTIEDVYQYSYGLPDGDEPLKFYWNDNNITFTNQYGSIFTTPYRPEIQYILSNNGYKSGFISVSNNPDDSSEYQWIKKIADEENIAKTCEDAYVVADSKGIKPFSPDTKKLHIKEIPLDTYYAEKSTNTRYYSLANLFLRGHSKENIGTYIVVNEKTLIICDEYGRTFLVKTKYIINDIVNNLIDAGYTRTLHPEWYIKEYLSTDAPEEE